MKRRAIPFVVAAVLIAIGATWWWEVGRPQQQAFEVAEILSGRDYSRVAFGTGLVGRAERLWATLRGHSAMNDAYARNAWALAEVEILATKHPTAIERVAVLESTPLTRRLLIASISKTDAFRRLPLADRVDEAVEHSRYEEKLAPPENDALLEGRALALPRLHEMLRQGHCTVLTQLALLHDEPAPGELADALSSGSDSSYVCKAALSERQP